MNVLQRMRSLLPPWGAVGRGVRGALTVMAFTDSGWMRRFRVPKLAVLTLAGFFIGLAFTAMVSVSFAVWAGADLRRLTTIEQENRSLAKQLQDQAAQLSRLQTEMSRLRELEKNLRSVSGLPEPAGSREQSGQGGGGVVPGPRR
jgi:hypothetical protein